MFAVAFIAIVVTIAVLTFIVWTVQKIFFSDSVAGRGRWFSAFLASAVITSLFLGSIGTFAVPAYSNLFATFGVELHTPTKFLVSARHALWLPAVLLLLSPRLPNRRFHNTRFLATFLVGESFLLLLVLWAIYLPIVVIGCAKTLVN